MNSPSVRFNKQQQPEFFKELNRRVNQHFKDNLRSKHADWNMVLKTVFMLCVYFLPLFALLSGTISSLFVMFLMWVIMGMGMSGIGLSVMHDANHGAYSSNKRINHGIGFLINFLGGYHVNWKIQHNVLHHSFTNIHGHDEDIDKGILRMSPDQDHKPFFRFQLFYAPFLYSLLTIFWLLGKDFLLLYRYDKKDLLKGQNLTFYSALFQILFHKTWYVILTLVLPIMLLPFAWWQVLLGFLLMHAIAGLTLALIFQPAHVIEETNFYAPDEQGSVENNWAIHQLNTTSNFANKSRLFSWLIGGLNYQVEHHLFPHICHVHYRDLSPIVKQTAQEFGVPYHEYETFTGALYSHFSLLHALGTGAYDKALAEA